MSSLLAVDIMERATWIFVACGLLVVALLVAYVAVLYHQRRYFGSAESNEPVWTFQDLKELRDRGDLTEDEYQAMRAALLGSYRIEESDSEPVPPDVLQNNSDENGPDFDVEKSSQR